MTFCGCSLAACTFIGHFGQQVVHGLVQLLFVDTLGADYTFTVQDVDGRPAADVPGLGDWSVRALRAVPERAPANLLLDHSRLQRVLVRIRVDADQGERLVLEIKGDADRLIAFASDWAFAGPALRSEDVLQTHLLGRLLLPRLTTIGLPAHYRTPQRLQLGCRFGAIDPL